MTEQRTVSRNWVRVELHKNVRLSYERTTLEEQANVNVADRASDSTACSNCGAEALSALAKVSSELLQPGLEMSLVVSDCSGLFAAIQSSWHCRWHGPASRE